MKSQTSASPPSFRFSLRGLMGAVAILAILLAILVPTARMSDVDWRDPRAENLIRLGLLMLGETLFLYYLVLATVIAHGMISSAKQARQLRRTLVYGPLLLFIALVVLLEALDALAHRDGDMNAVCWQR